MSGYDCKAVNPYTCRVHGTELSATALLLNSEDMFLNIKEQAAQYAKMYTDGSVVAPFSVPQELTLTRLWVAENRSGEVCFISGTPLNVLMREVTRNRLYRNAAAEELKRLGYEEKDILLWQVFQVEVGHKEPLPVTRWQATDLCLRVETTYDVKLPITLVEETVTQTFRFSEHPDRYPKTVVEGYVEWLIVNAQALKRRQSMRVLK